MIYGERRAWYGKKIESFIVMHDDSHEATTPLPRRNLQVGETVDYCMWLKPDNFLVRAPAPSRIGISDAFGRIHWAKSGSLRDAIRNAKDELKKSGDKTG
jgi:hypothetical protein